MKTNEWNSEQDDLLAKNVLQCISNGQTQIVAFQKAESVIGRTAAACGFRWNSELRKRFTKEIEEAKSKGKLLKTKRTHKSDQTNEKPFTEFNWNEGLRWIEEGLKRLIAANERLISENEQLRKKLMERPSGDDLTVLMRIIDHARNIGATEVMTKTS